jgi:processive 1,2-diacylglycerol beta-glucosyltransferase
MRKYITYLILLCVVSNNLLSNEQKLLAQSTNTIPRKKIVIFTSKGGAGHTTVCNILKDELSDFDLIIINPFEKILSGFDPIKTITFSKLDVEKFHNKLIQKGWIKTENFIMYYPGRLAFYLSRNPFKKKIETYLAQEKPDLLISLMPTISYPSSSAAARLGIPFLLLTLDADLTMWLMNMKKCKHTNYAITIGETTPRIKKQLSKAHIPEKNIHIVGHPIRKEFFEPKNHKKIRAEWNIPGDKPVVLAMRGGCGSTKLIDYTKTLLKLEIPLHILVCIGRNTALINELNKLKPTKFVTFSIIPFTNKISDLMAISDLLITQPSPNACNEALAVGLPICIDVTDACIFWEKATIDLIEMHHGGTQFKKMSQLKSMVKKYVGTKRTKNLSANKSQFPSAIKSVINSLLTPVNSTKTLK